MTRDEESVREVIHVLSQFQALSGLKVNRDKTQMLKMGRSHASDSTLCVDLGLKWVNQIKCLGVILTPNPGNVEKANFEEKLEEIDTLLNSWYFKNLTIYGRIRIVKALALSKVTHFIQVIPDPNPDTSAQNKQVHLGGREVQEDSSWDRTSRAAP